MSEVILQGQCCLSDAMGMSSLIGGDKLNVPKYITTEVNKK